MAREVLTGAQLRAIVWFDTDWPVEAVGAACYELPISHEGMSVGETVEYLESVIARAGRAEADPVEGGATAKGLTITVVPGYDSVGWIQRMFLGIAATSGVGPYTHDTDLGDLDAGWGMEIAIVDPTAANSTLYRVYGGVVTQVSMGLAMPTGECKWSITYDAYKVVKSTGAPTAATSYDGERPLLYRDLSALTYDSGGGAQTMLDIIELTAELDLTAELIPTALNEGRAGLRSLGSTKVRGQLKGMVHSDDAYDDLAIARTPFELVATYTSGADSFAVTLPRARLQQGPITSGGPQGIPLERPIWASDNGAGVSISTSLTNGIASYPDPV
jgi:hypothetical protein